MAISVDGYEIPEELIQNEYEAFRKNDKFTGMFRIRILWSIERWGEKGGGEKEEPPSDEEARKMAEETCIDAALLRSLTLSPDDPKSWAPGPGAIEEEIRDDPKLYDALPPEKAREIADFRLRVDKVQQLIFSDMLQNVIGRDYQYFYDTNPGEFQAENFRCLLHIARSYTMETRMENYVELLEIRERLLAGGDWEEEARCESDTYDDDDGFIKAFAEHDLADEPDGAETAAAIFALKPGEISDVLDFGGRLHIVESVPISAESKGRYPLALIKDRLKMNTKTVACMMLEKALLNRLRAKAAIVRK